jgi:nucleotidyltransferase substrate binding protein (TIGR01987 family)
LEQVRGGLARTIHEPDDELARDGVIKRFDYSIDMCWKLMQRYLKDALNTDETQIRTKRDIFREAARHGLIDAPERWFNYYDARNKTAHIYRAEIAENVYGKVASFLDDADAFMKELKCRLN